MRQMVEYLDQEDAIKLCLLCVDTGDDVRCAEQKKNKGKQFIRIHRDVVANFVQWPFKSKPRTKFPLDTWSPQNLATDMCASASKWSLW